MLKFQIRSPSDSDQFEEEKEDREKEFGIEDQVKDKVEFRLDNNSKEKKRRKKYTAPVEYRYNLRKRNYLSQDNLKNLLLKIQFSVDCYFSFFSLINF